MPPKCGSCRDKNAESYTKITERHNLFKIITKLNQRRIYNPRNSYFCSLCVSSATNKLPQRVSSFSDHDVISFDTHNTSGISNVTAASSDEFDRMVSQKTVFSKTGTPMPIEQQARNEFKQPVTHTQTERQKPCPKRFKRLSPRDSDTAATSILNTTLPIIHSVENSENASVSISNAMLPSSPSDTSGSISESNLILNVHGEKGLQYDPSSTSSEELLIPIVGREEEIPFPIPQNPISVERVLSINTEEAIAGPSAPIPKRPRVRAPHYLVTGDTRQYFAQNQNNINIGNYSRTLGG